MTVAELIEMYGYEDVVIFENPAYEDAFIGMTNENRAVYDYDRMIECLMNEDDMTEEDAKDFIGYNTMRSLPYVEDSPVILYKFPDREEKE